MAANSQFNVGHDAQLVVVGPTGNLTLNVTEFDWGDEPHEVTSRPLNNPTVTALLPDRGKGHFNVDRNSNVLETLIAQNNITYDTGGTIPTGTVYAYVSETNGSTTTLSFTNVVFKLAKGGTYKQEDVVKQTLEFIYSRVGVV